MATPKVVKRYANRKLYDTERSCYVTLEDIATMIKAGDEVKVVDNKTTEDLTSVTFAQIIFEAEKKKSFMPLGLLRDIIQNGGDTISGLAREKAQKVQETAQRLKTGFEGKIQSFTSRGEAQQKMTESKLAELIQSSHKAIEDLQRGVEERVKGSVGTVSRYATLGRDMEDIRQRLASLEERLGKFQ